MLPSGRTARQLALLCTFLAFAVGCGSTVQPRQNSGAPVDATVSVGPAGGGETTGGALEGGAPGSAPDAGPQRGGPSTVVATPAASLRPTAVVGQVGPGVSPTSIAIGMQWEDTSGGTAFALGRDFSQGQIEDAARAVATHVNARGGLGGRRVELFFHRSNYTDAVRDVETENEKACTRFTQDRKVLVALYTIDLTESGARCLARRGVVTISDFGQFDSVLANQLGPHYYAPNSMTEDRGAEATVDALAPRGFFRGATIGVVVSDAPGYRRSLERVKRALARHRLTVAESFYTSATDTAKISSDMTPAVVRFRTRGVTHALFLDVQGLAADFFMNAAESQQYRPWYALNTNNFPSVTIQLVPAGQLAKAQVLSWTPYDVLAADEQPPRLPPMTAQCRGILRAAGLRYTDRVGEVAAVQVCSWLLLLKHAFDRGAQPNALSLQSHLEGMGRSVAPAATYGGRFGRGRHDGASTTRLLAYGAECKCWTYLAPGPTS